ncbi:hypothetical protein pf16_55 [Pseudomonas phage pf16]|uniref:Uncharacterized protein n=1 Tax=Pseudomonas phage pf16 TaxID=1815630 RepID=A0A1S5R3K7_9CAUD|nr:hypothetical protein FDG98_gp054 [Pseudomonas phage pf16]AND74978.1 hypothetical protein pf16_55 [Pseudomonas phage pf16]
MTTTTDLFQVASRQKLRFNSKVGELATEDLWDLPLTHATKVNLNDIAVGLHNQLKDTQVSFVSTTPNAVNATAQLKLDIVKHVIAVRQAEAAAAQDALQRKQKRQELDELIARKQQGELEGKSLDELIALRDAL